MRITLLVVGLIVVGLAALYYTPGISRARIVEPAVPAVLRADNARIAAMMAGDGAALAGVLSDELVFVHSDGRIEGKADYVKAMTAGGTAYTNARTSDVKSLKPSSEIVILIGTQDMRKKLGDTWSDIHIQFMSVWRNENGAWRMFAWQSMKPSGSSIVPVKK
jgi:hypothetical protein